MAAKLAVHSATNVIIWPFSIISLISIVGVGYCKNVRQNTLQISGFIPLHCRNNHVCGNVGSGQAFQTWLLVVRRFSIQSGYAVGSTFGPHFRKYSLQSGCKISSPLCNKRHHLYHRWCWLFHECKTRDPAHNSEIPIIPRVCTVNLVLVLIIKWHDNM